MRGCRLARFGVGVVAVLCLGTAVQAAPYEFQFAFGSHGSADGEFNHPFGVASDPAAGRYVVADFSNHRVQVFDTTGNPRGVSSGLSHQELTVAPRMRRVMAASLTRRARPGRPRRCDRGWPRPPRCR